IDKSQDYRENYRRLQEEMSRVKAGMVVSHPIGAMPFMKVEAKTGYPVSARVPSCLPGEREIGTETMLKREAGTRIERLTEHQRSILDNYVTEKGVDSILAVVHIDGNNMGMRIGELIRNDRTYESAISKMRQISHNIRYANQLTFHQMEEKYNAGHTENQYFVRPILVAGDDITYVCNGKIALDTVEYFCKRISEYDIYSDPSQAEDGQYWKENHKKNGMSVCAGIAFMSSHFPFYIAYDVAEECCKNAKDRAKKKENRDPAGDENGKIGNWVDFQICRNIHVTDFAGMRKHEYITRTGESLLRRPYFIPANDTDGTGKFALLDDSVSSFNRFKEDMAVFHPIPRTLLKELRNTYPRGRAAVTQIMQFWKSRGWELPAGPYLEPENSRPVARYYDALELMDLYMDPEGEDKA
ncbi:MAG: Cas10/Cmr2 second palm domain-containing protein, partial [Bilifractor sp.]